MLKLPWKREVAFILSVTASCAQLTPFVEATEYLRPPDTRHDIPLFQAVSHDLIAERLPALQAAVRDVAMEQRLGQQQRSVDLASVLNHRVPEAVARAISADLAKLRRSQRVSDFAVTPDGRIEFAYRGPIRNGVIEQEVLDTIFRNLSVNEASLRSPIPQPLAAIRGQPPITKEEQSVTVPGTRSTQQPAPSVPGTSQTAKTTEAGATREEQQWREGLAHLIDQLNTDRGGGVVTIVEGPSRRLTGVRDRLMGLREGLDAEALQQRALAIQQAIDTLSKRPAWRTGVSQGGSRPGQPVREAFEEARLYYTTIHQLTVRLAEAHMPSDAVDGIIRDTSNQLLGLLAVGFTDVDHWLYDYLWKSRQVIRAVDWHEPAPLIASLRTVLTPSPLSQQQNPPQRGWLQRIGVRGGRPAAPPATPPLEPRLVGVLLAGRERLSADELTTRAQALRQFQQAMEGMTLPEMVRRDIAAAQRYVELAQPLAVALEQPPHNNTLSTDDRAALLQQAMWDALSSPGQSAEALLGESLRAYYMAIALTEENMRGALSDANLPRLARYLARRTFHLPGNEGNLPVFWEQLREELPQTPRLEEDEEWQRAQSIIDDFLRSIEIGRAHV